MAFPAVNSTETLIRDAEMTSWYPACHLTYTRDTWVKLLQAPNQYADDEAKLLCQASADTWVAWVPGHGELLLDRGDFYC